MSKSKKITYKELNDRLSVAFTKLVELHRTVDYVHTLILKYISFNKDETKFRNYLEKENKENQKNEHQIEQS